MYVKLKGYGMTVFHATIQNIYKNLQGDLKHMHCTNQLAKIPSQELTNKIKVDNSLNSFLQFPELTLTA